MERMLLTKFSDKKRFYSNEESNNKFDDQENSDSDSNSSYLVLMALEDQSINESDSCEVDDLMKSLTENDKLRNVNKELESNGNIMFEEIKR